MTNTKRVLKDAIFEQFARIGKALSSPKRLEILYLLSQSERTVEALAKAAENFAVTRKMSLSREIFRTLKAAAEKQKFSTNGEQ